MPIFLPLTLEIINNNITIISVISIVMGAITTTLVFLIKYFITTKDRNTEVIMKDIKEMKEMFYKLSTDNSLINNTLSYSKVSLDTITIELTKIREIQNNQSRIIERLTSFKSIAEKQLTDLETKYHDLKKAK